MCGCQQILIRSVGAPQNNDKVQRNSLAHKGMIQLPLFPTRVSEAVFSSVHGIRAHIDRRDLTDTISENIVYPVHGGGRFQPRF